MTGRFIPLGLLCIAVVPLTACAVDPDKYPSLAIREAELNGARVTGQIATASPPAVQADPPSPQLIADLLDRAAVSHQSFITARPRVARIAQTAGPSASDSNARSRALIAFAELRSLRSDTAIALASLDALAVDSAIEFIPDDEVAAAQALVLDMIREQDRALEQLDRELQR